MTPAELHREIARLIEENEALQFIIHQKEKEIEELKALPAREEKTWYTSREAAAFIGRSPAWLDKDRMLAKPTVPYTKKGYRTVRYHRNDLEAYNNSGKLRKTSV